MLEDGNVTTLSSKYFFQARQYTWNSEGSSLDILLGCYLICVWMPLRRMTQVPLWAIILLTPLVEFFMMFSLNFFFLALDCYSSFQPFITILKYFNSPCKFLIIGLSLNEEFPWSQFMYITAPWMQCRKSRFCNAVNKETPLSLDHNLRTFYVNRTSWKVLGKVWFCFFLGRWSS